MTTEQDVIRIIGAERTREQLDLLRVRSWERADQRERRKQLRNALLWIAGSMIVLVVLMVVAK